MTELPPTGWPTLWSAALEIAAARRAGRTAGPWLRPSQGLDEHDADLFALYEPLVERGPASPPWVIAHLGQSLDGFIATHNGDSRFVTGPHDLDHMHRLRALCDAVIVGAGTVVADDPLLTTRRVPGCHATRVVLDPMLSVPVTARVLQSGDAPTLWLCDERWHDPALARQVAARVLPLPGLVGDDGLFDAHVARRALVAQGLRLLFVEGGGVTVSRFLAQGLLDRLHLALAPVLIGEGRRGVRLSARSTMADGLRPGGRTVRLGEDVLWDFALEPGGRSAPA
jgi:diaminohydroxyphosphoribosylaminopyrimidine deaminase / 5-amino-6-(5-phosphoribosylamino)uracil reductase